MSTANRITTYTADVSICSQICRLAVQEHGLSDAEDVSVDIEYAMENYDPWFVRIQPSMTVPVMRYGDATIGDSKDILFFLADKHPEAGLYPADARAAIDVFINGFYDSFMAIGVFTFGNLVSKSDSLKRFILQGKTDVTLAKLEALSRDPELAEAAHAKLEQIKLRDFSLLDNPQLLANVETQIQVLLDTLDANLADGREFAVGSSYTLADIVATALLARVHFIKADSLFTPRLAAYWQGMQARPSFLSANVCDTWEKTLMAKQYETFLADGA